MALFLPEGKRKSSSEPFLANSVDPVHHYNYGFIWFSRRPHLQPWGPLLEMIRWTVFEDIQKRKTFFDAESYVITISTDDWFLPSLLRLRIFCISLRLFFTITIYYILYYTVHHYILFIRLRLVFAITIKVTQELEEINHPVEQLPFQPVCHHPSINMAPQSLQKRVTSESDVLVHSVPQRPRQIDF